MTEAERIARIEREAEALQVRVRAVEIDLAKSSENLANIASRLETIQTYLGRILWLVMAIITGGLMKFIMDGGLNVLPTP